MSASNFNVNNSLGFVIGKTSRALHRHLNRSFAEKGIDLNAEQWIVLLHLHRQDGITQQELCDCAMKDKTSTTRLLNTMEKNGLVVRVPDQNDRRVKRIYRTVKAKEIQEKMFDGATRMIRCASEGIDPEALEQCKDVLRQVFLNLEGKELRFLDNNV